MFDSMRSGDLMVFSNTANTLISKATNSPYTHVGLVLLVRGGIYIFESNVKPDTPDAFSLRTYDGVIIRDLRKVVGRCKEVGTKRVWWAPRTTPLTKEQEVNLLTFALMVQGRPYDYVQAAFSPLRYLDRLFSRGIDPFSKLFCSELVVLAELATTGMVYHRDHEVPINASTVVPREVLELHVGGVPIWGEMIPM